jgi:hypothetical protein
LQRFRNGNHHQFETDQTNQCRNGKKGCPVYAENLVIDILTEDCKINLETGDIDVSDAR